jgi:enoyl-CoA hydratase
VTQRHRTIEAIDIAPEKRRRRMETTFIEYGAKDQIATITLNRAEAANAQTLPMLDDLDEAWCRAAEDDDVRVVILQANGKHFSAGHDMKGVSATGDEPPTWSLAGVYQTEARRFLEYSLRWRNIPKPSIAAVQGVCIAGGLLLAWPCDLIIAADNARFSDPVVNMGIGGVEYHGHTWEWGARKAKEMLFTGRSMTAEEAERLGMVNRVVPLEDLRADTRTLAVEIAAKHPFALRQAKRAVNQTLDVMGFYAAVQSVFDIHQTGHGHALSVSGLPMLMLLDDMKAEVAKSASADGP